MNNAPPQDYGFNIPESSTPTYGFNSQVASQQMPMPMQSPMQPYQNQQSQIDNNYSNQQFATQLLAEPIVANMALKYGDALVDSGKQHLEKYVPVTALKYYFAVDTDYVFLKLLLLFFPFTHKVYLQII